MVEDIDKNGSIDVKEYHRKLAVKESESGPMKGTIDVEQQINKRKADYDKREIEISPKVKIASSQDNGKEKSRRDYILIGHPNPSTGPLAIMGDPSPWTNYKAAAVINVQGGIYIKEYGKKLPVKIKMVDTESDPAKAARLTTNLILQDKVDMMVVMHTPDTVNPVTAVCEIYKVPCVSTQAPIDPWLENGPYEWSYHTFWTVDSVLNTYSGIWDQYADQTSRVVGCLWPNDPDGVTWSRIADKKFPARGYKVVKYAGFPYMTSDFSPAIKLFKDKNVDILTGVLILPDFATFWRQAQRMGFHPKIVTIGKCIEMPAPVNMLASEGLIPRGWTTEIWWCPESPFKSSLTGQTAREFGDSWSADTGKQTTMVLGFVHAGFEIAFDALKRAQTLDKEKLRQAIEETDLDTIVGHIEFNDEHYCETPLVGGQWNKGDKWPWELKIIHNKKHPEIPKTGEMIFPLSK
jgi:branched-chain amino acid transport system substrate-binding protein